MKAANRRVVNQRREIICGLKSAGVSPRFVPPGAFYPQPASKGFGSNGLMTWLSRMINPHGQGGGIRGMNDMEGIIGFSYAVANDTAAAEMARRIEVQTSSR